MATIFNKFAISAIPTDFASKGKRNFYSGEVTIKNVMTEKQIRMNVSLDQPVDTDAGCLKAFYRFIQRGIGFDTCFDRFCEVQELDPQDVKSKKKWRNAEHYSSLFKYLCDDDPAWLVSELDKALQDAA